MMDLGRSGLRVLLALMPMWPAVGSAATLSAGGDHTCAIDVDDGHVRCWGRGNSGQLGDGYSILLDRAAPVEVDTSEERLRSVASGGSHSCGLTTSGGVRCWGLNSSGQLGDGTTLYRAVPTPVTGLSSGVKALALGTSHTCALMQTGSVKCWGESDNGRLGTGQTSDQPVPGDVLGLAGAIAIGAGEEHSCALVSGGQMKCWGRNNAGQIGDGTTTTRTTPVAVTVSGSVSAIAVGGYHTCALTSTGGMQCWGRNSSGQLGDGTNSSRSLPVAVDGLSSGVTRIAAGGDHTCALAAGSVMKCWGENGRGQVGDGTTADFNRPTNVGGLGEPVVEMSLGDDNSCIRSTYNRILCWGSGDYGKSGNGNANQWNPETILRPWIVSGLTSAPVRLALRRNTSCAATEAGGAMCWGVNDYGQVGNGAQTTSGGGIDSSGASDVYGLESGVLDVAAGEQHACAAKADGTVWCWGRNNYHQLADGTTIARNTPVPVLGASDAVAVTAGLSFTCALTSAGAVMCWGRNDSGQLGDGSLEDRDHAVAVVGLDHAVVSISAGERHICALLDDGGVKCWGRNFRGQVGDGSTTDRYLPTAIDDSGTPYAAISAGGEHTCGMTTAGAAKCWGYNPYGELGDGTQVQRTAPVSVDGLASGVTAIGAGGYHSCAVKDGLLKCWGHNNNYQVGDGTLATRILPVDVVGLGGTVVAIALGYDGSCVRLADGRARCWGSDYSGQLGDGSIGNNMTAPVDIGRWFRTDVIFRDGFD